MIEASTATTRGADLKVLPNCVVMPDILRNALRRRSRSWWSRSRSVGGRVVVQVLFNYQGVGSLIDEAVRQKDLPLLTAGALEIGIVYLTVTLIADLLYADLNPRIRFGSMEWAR